MSEWDDVTLGSLASRRKGITYKSEHYDTDESGHPFITIKCFVKGGGYDPQGLKYYEGPYTKADQLEAGDILFAVTDLTRAGDIVGSPLRVPDFGGGKPPLASMDCMRIDPIEEVCDGEFLYQRMMLSDVRRQMVALSAGSTVLHLDVNKVPSLILRVPVRAEAQRAIAKVLGVVDQAIEKTEALIGKYQRIKAGLMHDLFTRGIGADGKLRPPPEQAPELYQETPIGWIPKDWSLNPCSDVCKRISVGIVIQPSQYYVDDGVPAFRSANIREQGIEPANIVYISPASNSLLAKSQIQAGDILSIRTGYPGTSAVVPAEFSGSNCIDVLISTPGEKVRSAFLCYWINSAFGKEQVLRQQGGMAQQHFNVSEMKELLAAVPDLAEQDEICKMLGAGIGKLTLEESRRKKLVRQKAGLMRDLLTGKVQVKPNPRAPAHA